MVRDRGIEPRDLVLSGRELRPAAFVAVSVRMDECPPRDSNPEPSDPESDASASWARRAWRREDELNACPISGTPGFRRRCPTARASLSMRALLRPAILAGLEPAVSSSTVRRALLAALQDHAPPAAASRRASSGRRGSNPLSPGWKPGVLPSGPRPRGAPSGTRTQDPPIKSRML